MSNKAVGFLRTMSAPGFGPQEVMDLVPVKAPREMETPVTEVFRRQLPASLPPIQP